MAKLDVKDLDIKNLEEIDNEIFFEHKEKIERATKFIESSKDNHGHKKQGPRKPKIQ